MKLPPFGKELQTARKAGQLPDVWIMAGDHSWNRARARKPPRVLCLPPDAEFTEYDWRCVAGLHPTLVAWNWPPDRIDAFARHLVHAGARLVAALAAEHDGVRVVSCRPVFYKPTRARVAA